MLFHSLQMFIKTFWDNEPILALSTSYEGEEQHPLLACSHCSRVSVSGASSLSPQIRADPSDINVLPEYDRDPRVVANLVDGVYRTRDDTHMWLAPFTAGRQHYVYITLKERTRIALMRIWVSATSGPRDHSFRFVASGFGGQGRTVASRDLGHCLYNQLRNWFDGLRPSSDMFTCRL